MHTRRRLPILSACEPITDCDALDVLIRNEIRRETAHDSAKSHVWAGLRKQVLASQADQPARSHLVTLTNSMFGSGGIVMTTGIDHALNGARGTSLMTSYPYLMGRAWLSSCLFKLNW